MTLLRHIDRFAVFHFSGFCRSEMPSFRWPYVAHDVALATEVASVRPTNATEWDQIANTLSASFSTTQREVEIKGRGCREWMDLLIRKYKVEDARALKRLDYGTICQPWCMRFPICLQMCLCVFVCICACLLLCII